MRVDFKDYLNLADDHPESVEMNESINILFDSYYYLTGKGLGICNEHITDSIAFCTTLEVVLGEIYGDVNSGNRVIYSYFAFSRWARFFVSKKGSFQKKVVSRMALCKLNGQLRIYDQRIKGMLKNE